MTSHQPATYETHTGSRKALQSIRGPDFLGGRRGRMKHTQSIRAPRLMNPSTLLVHANPSCAERKEISHWILLPWNRYR